MTTSIDMETLLTTIFVEVDDWFEEHGREWRAHKSGVRPRFTDSEMLTLLLAQEYVPYPGEAQFVGHMRANYGALFPALPDPSQFNRRAKSLRELLEPLRLHWLRRVVDGNPTVLIVDTKPIPVVGYRRSKKHSDFAGSASYGYCASRKMYYFGYKLVTLTTLTGVPVVYELVPAHTDERPAAESVLQHVRQCDVLSDKGLIGYEWQLYIEQTTGNRVWTFLKRDQKQTNPPVVTHLLDRFRRRIETTFHCLQNTGRHLEHLLARSVIGLCTRVAAKMTAHILTLLLQRVYQINVRTFELA